MSPALPLCLLARGLSIPAPLVELRLNSGGVILVEERDTSLSDWRAHMAPLRTIPEFCLANYPVMTASWVSALIYANRKLRSEGYHSAYQQDFFSGRWSRNHLADGYRLPTVDEWRQFALGASALDGVICDYANVRDSGRPGPGDAHVLWQQGTIRTQAQCDDGWRGPAPVGSILSPSGLVMDAVGNATEWVERGGTEFAVIASSWQRGGTWEEVTMATDLSAVRGGQAGIRLVRPGSDGGPGVAAHADGTP